MEDLVIPSAKAVFATEDEGYGGAEQFEGFSPLNGGVGIGLG